MIESVEIMNFLSHQESLINLDGGVTVFIGQNGAGKSGVIDAVTFALFGRHSRKSNKSIVRWGQTRGYVSVVIGVGGKRYKAVRKFDKRGGLEAQFSRDMSGEWMPLASGERKQFGESMTGRIEGVIGLGYEKLRIASIVQQGELESIVRAKPKEFKELINSVIGIDRLDVASEGTKEVVRQFREYVRGRFGYDDTSLDTLHAELDGAKRELAEAAPERDGLVQRRGGVVARLKAARGAVEEGAPKLEMTRQLAERRAELTRYAGEAVRGLMREVTQNERRIRECTKCFEVDGGRDFGSEVAAQENAIEEARRKAKELAGTMASLEERLSLAARLQLKDGRCPVCDTEVAGLHPMFREEHLREEIADAARQEESWEAAARERVRARDEVQAMWDEYRRAQTVLKTHSIGSREDLETLRRDTEAKKAAIPPGTTSSADPADLAKIDAHAADIFRVITALERETSGFDKKRFEDVKRGVDAMQREASEMDRQIGAAQQRIAKAEADVERLTGIVKELDVVGKYVAGLETMRTRVFDRNGAVATSLRSWALESISRHTSDYLMKLNTKIHRVHLSETARDVSIACYSNKEVLEIESLSGGEQVAVALALRLGMASLLGAAAGFNTIILDEPTAHLDVERKKALVGVLSGLSDVSGPEGGAAAAGNAAGQMQFIIITHDAEIFEDSHVEQVYKFKSDGAGGATVIEG